MSAISSASAKPGHINLGPSAPNNANLHFEVEKVIAIAKNEISNSSDNSISKHASPKTAKEENKKEVSKLKILEKPAADPQDSVSLAIGASVGQLLEPPIVTKEDNQAKNIVPFVTLDDDGLHIQFHIGQKEYARKLAVSLEEAGFRGVKFENGAWEMGSSLRGGVISISSPIDYLELIAKHCNINNEEDLVAFIDKRKDDLSDDTKEKIANAFVNLTNKGIIVE